MFILNFENVPSSWTRCLCLLSLIKLVTHLSFLTFLCPLSYLHVTVCVWAVKHFCNCNLIQNSTLNWSVASGTFIFSPFGIYKSSFCQSPAVQLWDSSFCGTLFTQFKEVLFFSYEKSLMRVALFLTEEIRNCLSLKIKQQIL